MIIALQDKVIKGYMDFIGVKDFIGVSNEGEAIAIAGGCWLGTKKRADVYMSADGLCNAMNFITSWVIPENIEMNIFVSSGREEPPHKVMTDILPELLELIPYDPKKVFIKVVYKKEAFNNLQ